MTQKKQKVAMTNGHGEPDQNQGFTYLKHVEEFEVTTVNPSTGADPGRRRRAADRRPEAAVRRSRGGATSTRS